MSDYISNVKKQSLNRYNITIKSDLLDCTVFWARVVNSENESLFTKYTKHTFYEVQYAVAGKIVMKTDRDNYVNVAESDFIIIPPDTYHQIVDGDSVGKRFIMGFSIAAADEKLKRAIDRMSDPVPHHDTPYMRDLLKLILEKVEDDSPTCDSIIIRLTESLLLEMLGIICPPDVRETGQEHKMTENELLTTAICDFISSKEGVGLKVADISRRFNISERHLNRIFKQNFGKSVGEIISYEKLQKIEKLAASTSLTFSEISELCGFSDEYAMNKFFRRLNLIGLSEYRKTVKK